MVCSDEERNIRRKFLKNFFEKENSLVIQQRSSRKQFPTQLHILVITSSLVPKPFR